MDDSAYAEERKELTKGEINAVEKYDQYMIALASGALGLSLTYLEKLVRPPVPGTLYLLVSSWYLFGGTLMVVVLSYLWASFTWKQQRKIWDLEYCERNAIPIPPDLARLRRRKGWRNNPVNVVPICLNVLSFLVFTAGVWCFLQFATTNLSVRWKGATMADNETRETKKGEERGVPAIPPRVVPPKEQPKPEPDKKS